MFKNTEIAYGLGTRIIHWTMALMIITILIVGFYMVGLPKTDYKWDIYGIHKATGTVILVLVLLRILWRLSNVWPLLPDSVPSWQAFLANLNIFFLYCAMLAMPLSGFFGSLLGGHDISFYGLFIIPAIAENNVLSGYLWDIHHILPYFLVASIALHLLAALHHHFILKDNVLRRMWSGS